MSLFAPTLKGRENYQSAQAMITT